MKREVVLSFLIASNLIGNDNVTLEPVLVTYKINSKVIKNVSKENIKSADLADALMKNVPSVSIVRRSGVANDVILRGQKKDNINILIDDAKIYGACPNRMDPAISHILTNNVENINIIEGPYDVENFGTLSGKIDIKTKEPKKGLDGEVNLSMGSFGYKKLSTQINGGNDFFKYLISASKEKSEQYKDGNGDDFFSQQKNQICLYLINIHLLIIIWMHMRKKLFLQKLFLI